MATTPEGQTIVPLARKPTAAQTIDIHAMANATPFDKLELCMALDVDPVSIVRNLEDARLLYEAATSKKAGKQLIIDLLEKWEALSTNILKEARKLSDLPESSQLIAAAHRGWYVREYVKSGRREIDQAYAMPKQDYVERALGACDERQRTLTALYWRARNAEEAIRTPLLAHLAQVWGKDFPLT